nr:hypothetical protein [Gordonia sp. LAM0048]
MSRASSWETVIRELDSIRGLLRSNQDPKVEIARFVQKVATVDEYSEVVAYILASRYVEVIEDARYYADEDFPTSTQELADLNSGIVNSISRQLVSFDPEINLPTISRLLDSLSTQMLVEQKVSSQIPQDSDHDRRHVVLLTIVLTTDYHRIDVIKNQYLDGVAG